MCIKMLNSQFNYRVLCLTNCFSPFCRYLYTIDNIGVVQPDQTLELLMQDLDEDVMSIFTMDQSATAEECTKVRKHV